MLLQVILTSLSLVYLYVKLFENIFLFQKWTRKIYLPYIFWQKTK